MQELPHVHLVDASPARGQASFSAFVALTLDSIGSALGHEKDRLQFLGHSLNRQVDFISALPGIGAGAAAEIRIVSTPEPGAPQRGKVRVALRLRATAGTADLAREGVLEAVRGLHPNLAAISDAYQWLPLTGREAYGEFFADNPPHHIAELMRREALLPLDRLRPLPPKRAIGFLAGNEGMAPPRSDPTDVYFVFPYVRTFSSLKTLFDILLMQGDPVTISLAVAPTRISDGEMEVLRSQVERCESFLQHERRHGNDPDALAAPLKHRANNLLQALHRFTFSLLDDCFQTRVTVASPAPIPAGLMEALGTTLTESVNSQDPYSDASTETQHLTGGHDWLAAETPDQQTSALKNLEHLGFAIWSDTLAPEGSERLRYLADARQANAVFRLPIPAQGHFPGLESRRARAISPPANLPDQGLFIGDNLYRGFRQGVRLLRDDRRRHMYMVGQTGTGKSALLHQMIMQDVRNGEGVCVVDPHGELVDDVLACIPEHRVDDVVYIDPTDPNSAVGLNLLDFRDTFDRESAINHLLEIFDELYDMRQAGGPIFEQYLRNSAHLATGCGRRKATFADIIRVFSDHKYRNALLNICADPLVRSFWMNIATKVRGDNWSLPDMAAYVTSKLSRMIYNGLMRPIVLQRESTVDLLGCMNERKIVLIDLAKGKLGETNARFLGMILLSLITRAAFSRSECADPKTLPDFYLYVDEFQNLATDSFSAILSEARKYRLNLIISNQYLHQIPQHLQEAVLGNAGTVLSFRVGLQDAELLEKRYSNGASRFDLMSLPNFNAYLTTLLHGEATPVFDIKTRLFEGVASEGTAARIRKMSAERYSSPRAEIEAEIEKTLGTLRSP